MGKADVVTKNYMRQNHVFADAFNYLIYGGEHVIHEQELREVDTTEMALPYVEHGSEWETSGKKVEYDLEAGQKYRDILKRAVIKQDGNACYIRYRESDGYPLCDACAERYLRCAAIRKTSF